MRFASTCCAALLGLSTPYAIADCAAEAITKRRGKDDILAFYKEFALQLTLYKVPFKACYEKEAKAIFNEAFRIEQDFKKSLRKHQSAFSSW